MTTVLRIEHSVARLGFDTWKAKVWTPGSPIGVSLRDALGDLDHLGLRRCRLLRSLDKPDFIVRDYEFETREGAERFLDASRRVWSQVPGLMAEAVTSVEEVIEDLKR
jgi:hypothetical protein